MLFPPSINLCRNGYSRNLKGEQTPQTFDAWQRQRRKVRRRGVIDTVCWMVDNCQCNELEQFHRRASGHYFEIDLPAYNGLITTSARFDGPLTIRPMRDHFEITASLYIPQPSIMNNDKLDNALLIAMGVVDDTFGKPLYYWVNINWSVFWHTGISDSAFNQSLNDWLVFGWAILFNTGIENNLFSVPLHQFVNQQWPSLITGVRS